VAGTGYGELLIALTSLELYKCDDCKEMISWDNVCD